MSRWESGPLESEHDLDGFECGNDSLNGWLINSARRVDYDRIARVHVWTAAESRSVVAYFAIMPTMVAREELTSAQSKGTNPVPGFLLAKMALHSGLHGQGLGGELLVDALARIVEASDRGGGRLIVVDAIDDSAVGFYGHYGFKPVKKTSHRMVMTVADARKNLGIGSIAVSADEQLDLVSMVYKGPDGKSLPFIGDPDEARLIADKLMEVIAANEAAGKPSSQVDLRAAMTEAIGRDPFVSE